MDAAPPPEQSPPAYVYAATDERPRTPREIELCEKASHPDWLYLGGAVVADVASIWLDGRLKYNPSRGVRYLGPAALGLSWGLTLGGGYLALPKCSKDWVESSPPEGDVRSSWQMAVVVAGLAGVMAPFLEGTEIGGLPTSWPVGERSLRLVLASAGGVTGALLPYLLPPKTWRAAKELEHLRAGATEDGRGAFVSWGFRF